MKKTILLLSFFCLPLIAFSQKKKAKKRTASLPPIEKQTLFEDERFPNIVVATNGDLVASWGSNHIRVRRSEDGGKTWLPADTIVSPGFQGGGMLVNEINGEIFLFVEEKHPPAKMHLYISKDHGKTWEQRRTKVLPNSLGHVPSLHMNERGITLKSEAYKGRLIRPSRYYGKGNDQEHWDTHYANAMYSDDGGNIWYNSEPFPAFGTGEGAIVELSDGTLYYNSRRHKSTDGLNPRKRYSAISKDGGKTWTDLKVHEELPDGDQNRDYGLMGGMCKLAIPNRDVLLFSNIESPEGRHHGTVWVSLDGGQTWPKKVLVERGSFAYSSIIGGKRGSRGHGKVFLMYESNGKAKVARIDQKWFLD